MYNFNSQQITQVNGEMGANAYQMLPNSSALLLDTSSPIIWFCQTDGAGYKTVTPYEIKPLKKQEPVDLNQVLERLERIEERLNEPNTTANAKRKSKDDNADEQPN